MKKILLTALCILLCISLTGCNLISSIPTPTEMDRQKVATFYALVYESQTLLDEVSGDIYTNWYDAIYNDKFDNDINLAVEAATADNQENIAEIQRLDDEIVPLFSEIKDSELGSQIKAVMSAYLDYYELVINVEGTFNTYSADRDNFKRALDQALKNLYLEV